MHTKKCQSNRPVILKMDMQQYIRYGHHIASAFIKPLWENIFM